MKISLIMKMMRATPRADDDLEQLCQLVMHPLSITQPCQYLLIMPQSWPVPPVPPGVHADPSQVHNANACAFATRDQQYFHTIVISLPKTRSIE